MCDSLACAACGACGWQHVGSAFQVADTPEVHSFQAAATIRGSCLQPAWRVCRLTFFLNTPWSPAKPGLYPCSPGEALVRPNSSCRTAQSRIRSIKLQAIWGLVLCQAWLCDPALCLRHQCVKQGTALIAVGCTLQRLPARGQQRHVLYRHAPCISSAAQEWSPRVRCCSATACAARARCGGWGPAQAQRHLQVTYRSCENMKTLVARRGHMQTFGHDMVNPSPILPTVEAQWTEGQMC